MVGEHTNNMSYRPQPTLLVRLISDTLQSRGCLIVQPIHDRIRYRWGLYGLLRTTPYIVHLSGFGPHGVVTDERGDFRDAYEIVYSNPPQQINKLFGAKVIIEDVRRQSIVATGTYQPTTIKTT